MRKTTLKRKNVITEIIKNHVYNNIKEYLIASIILLIGIIFGVLFINHTSEIQKIEINQYITNFINTLKNSRISNEILLRKSILNNSIIAGIMWFAGSTIIGIPIVLGIIAFRGFCISYTISSLIYSFGTGKGLLFAFFAIIPHNIIFIPAILALAVTGIRLYEIIIKDRNIKNIRVEIIKYTIISLIIYGLMVIASFVEAYFSIALLKTIIKYI